MIELVYGTGMAAGKTIPLRVPLGTDGWSRIKGNYEENGKVYVEWEEVNKEHRCIKGVVDLNPQFVQAGWHAYVLRSRFTSSVPFLRCSTDLKAPIAFW